MNLKLKLVISFFSFLALRVSKALYLRALAILFLVSTIDELLLFGLEKELQALFTFFGF
jgi:hypothetical protein